MGIDSGAYRNARASHMHNVLGFDHQNPDNLCARASRDTRQTGWGAVKRVRRAAGGAFEATDVSGKTWVGRSSGWKRRWKTSCLIPRATPTAGAAGCKSSAPPPTFLTFSMRFAEGVGGRVVGNG